MADKKMNRGDSSDIQDTPSDLTTLRQIIYGAAKEELEKRVAELERRMEDSFQRAEATVNKQVQELTSAMKKGLEVLTEKVDSVDKHHDDKNTELFTYADKLSSEMEMSDTNSRQDVDQLHTRLDSEVAQLTEKYDARFAEALDRLDQVTRELSSTKTDRKTLARLLATMAVNLESDED
ncbi:hypothetical protein [Aliiglaciecola litoralis]|uniref:Uncharacterized protein n=1 Tax=Aliiglaciecola litoralis TaxID=582857 RepID=A0ABP3X4N9_9ALTE